MHLARIHRIESMQHDGPSRVLISGGHETGGVTSFAEALRAGFAELGIPAEVIPSSRIFLHGRDLRDPGVLKILSTTAVFAAPIARRAICVAHGFPRPDVQGWIKTMGIAASFKLANCSARLVAVSHYAAVHLRTIFNIRVDAVIHNPLDDLFLDQSANQSEPRRYITFAGRLHPSKRLDLILPAMRAVLDENPGLRAVIIGDGKLRPALAAAISDNARIELAGQLSRADLRNWLRRTLVFVSGCETEALGIAYLEALSQGCAIVMPATGGGVEIAPDMIGSAIHLYSGAFSQAVARALRSALIAAPARTPLASYSPRVIARAYLALDCGLEAQTAELVEVLS